MERGEKLAAMPENDEDFFKIADRRLKMMELDYEMTLAADKCKDELQLKGKFESLEFNNVKFENSEKPASIVPGEENKEPACQENKENIKNSQNIANSPANEGTENNKEHEDDDESNSIENENYQALSENSNEKEHEEDDQWGEMQVADVKKEEQPKQEISIDAQKIKNIMAKIQIKPPEWAGSTDIWKMKLTQMCKDLADN